MSSDDPSELIRHPEIASIFDKEINLVNKRLNPPERINRIPAGPDEWSPATGELSPTLKLRRQFITTNTGRSWI
jgi:long-chain acyl-CoA synthetase